MVVVGAGVLIRLSDSTENPNVGVWIWWALHTVTTVGYGDVTPSHVAGRLVGAAVMGRGMPGPGLGEAAPVVRREVAEARLRCNPFVI